MAPAASADVPVPTFFELGMYLERTNCTPPFQPIDFWAPVKCKQYEMLSNTSLDRMGWSIAINDGYELALWGTNDCSGEPLAKVKDKRNWCQFLPTRINSLSVRPLFNADYDLSLASGRPLRQGEKCAPSECPN